MARMPGWIAVSPKSQWELGDDKRTVQVPIRIRWWHPGLWVELVKHMRIRR